MSNERLPLDEQLSDSDSSDSSSGSADLGSSTELELILKGIRQSISYLYKLAITVRNPTPTDRLYTKHDIDTSCYECWDIQHVGQRLPLLASVSPFLLQRLGKANSRRRQVFKYNKKHHEKLQHGVDAYTANLETVVGVADHITGDQERTFHPVSVRDQDEVARNTPSERAPTLDTQTTVATFLEKDPDRTELDFDDGLSETLSVLTEGSPEEDDFKFPEPPLGALGDDYFECPYCCEVSRIPNMIQWK